MKFEEIYINGFGIFHDYHIENLAPNLNILVGPNEAGKSTILSFLKRVLFGFPDRRSEINHYPPLAGGNHGGRLVVLTRDKKRYVIERYLGGARDVNVTLPDGSVGGTAELFYILGYVSKGFFENVCAFSLTELQDFETLNSKEVRERLYSAGMGMGAVSLLEVQRTIEKDMGELFKHKGSTQEINALFKSIREINARLRTIEDDIPKFDKSHRILGDVTKEVETIKQDLNQTSTKLGHTQNLIHVWDDWRKIQEDKELLQKIPEVKNFPGNGVEQLERFLEKIEGLKKRISEIEEKLKNIRIQKSQIRIDERLIGNKDRIIELQKGQTHYTSVVKDLPAVEEKLKRDQRELKELLHEIGPEWDEEKLSKFDRSIPAKETVRKKHYIIEKLKEDIHDTEKEIRGIDQNINHTKEQIEKINEDLKAQPPIDEKKLRQQRESIHLLREKTNALDLKEIEIRNLQEKEELLTILKPYPTEVVSRLPFWPALMFIATGFVSLILSILGNNWVVGISVLVLLLITTVIYIVLSKKKLPTTAIEEFKDQDAEDLIKKSRDFSERRNKLGSELQKIKIEISSNAQICGFEDIPDPRSIENKDLELQTVSENILKSNELNKNQEMLKQELKNLSDGRNTVESKLGVLRKDEEEVKKEWKNWLIEKRLESELTPDGVNDIFTTIKTCIEKKKSNEVDATRIEKMKESIKKYETQLSSVLEDCNRKKEKINAIVESEKITQELNQTLEDSKTLERLDIEEKNHKSDFQNLKDDFENRQRECSELLSKGSAKSETEFRDNSRNWDERNKLTYEILQKEQNIKRISGDSNLYYDFINELKETSLEDLEKNKSQLQRVFEEGDNKLSERREKLGGIRNEIEQIKQLEEGSSLRMERAIKTQKLREKSEEWSILILARTIMRKVVEKYEKEKQPRVINEAQSFFSKMTLDRYLWIYAPLGEEKIYVEDKDGKRKDIRELSRGTAEQLYLSLRFGFIREFNKTAEFLPIIFDDILVNFDPERFRAACIAIKELTTTNQVLYFTCHPETVNLLTEIIPDSKIIDINVGG